MLGDEQFAEVRDRFLRTLDDQELVRVRAAVRPHRGRLASPDQLRPAQAEVSPAAPREVARLAVGRPVPAFHRKDAEPVSDAHAVALERLAERRRTWGRQRLVEFEGNRFVLEVRTKRGGGPQRCHARVTARAHSVSSVFFSTASFARIQARADSRPDRAPHASGVPTRIAAQKREISLRVGEGMSPPCPGSVVACPGALAGRVSDASTTAPAAGVTWTPVERCSPPSSKSSASFSPVMNNVAFVPKKIS